MKDTSENSSDRFARLKKRLDEKTGEYADAWRPEQGDDVVGDVIRVDAHDGGHGEYSIVTLATEKGEVAIHAFKTVLRSKFEEREPKPGDLIAVKYLGSRESSAGRTYDDYTVVWEDASSPPRAALVEDGDVAA